MDSTKELVLKLLRDAAEREEIAKDGIKWGTVYLDNARPSTLTAHQFAGYLSALAKDGLYRDESDRDFKGIFGYVKMEPADSLDADYEREMREQAQDRAAEMRIDFDDFDRRSNR